MLRTRRSGQPIPFRSTNALVLEAHFPRAIAGEEFHRYARTMWRHARFWMDRNWHRATGADVSMHDARESLRSIATAELGRRLHLQEERLLSEVLFEAWTARERELPDILPFWTRPSPFSPPPAA